jgi:predicted nucleotide-binding protein (sugar kinase/HSP70/actin superfamily)
MRLGIPKALLYHKYRALWTTFFEELGVETTLSKDSSRKTFDLGCRHCLDDICLPIKTYFGHVMELKDEVDAIFVPRIVSIEKRRGKRSYTCPKMIGLPDMLRAAIPGLPPLLDVKIDVNKKSEALSFIKLGLKLNANLFKVIKAYSRAREAQERDEGKKRDGRREMGDGKRIGLISHSYNLCGAYPTPDIERMLGKLGAVPMTIDAYPRKTLTDNADREFVELSWNYEREMLGGAIEMIKDKSLSGCIIITNFSCGPDSLTGDYILRYARRNSAVPFTMLTIDEHTGEAGLKTRIEAFLDMIGKGPK